MAGVGDADLGAELGQDGVAHLGGAPLGVGHFDGAPLQGLVEQRCRRRQPPQLVVEAAHVGVQSLGLAPAGVGVGQREAQPRLQALDLQPRRVQRRLLARRLSICSHCYRSKFHHLLFHAKKKRSTRLDGLAQLLGESLLVRFQRRHLLLVPARRLLLQVPGTQEQTSSQR